MLYCYKNIISIFILVWFFFNIEYLKLEENMKIKIFVGKLVLVY